MDLSTANKLLLSHNMPTVLNMEKIKIGFTNKVYFLGDNYVLKVCGDIKNEDMFRNESVFYKYFKDSLPVPRVHVYDTTKKVIDSHYMIYEKIRGENLYNVWHTMTNQQRKKTIKQLCELLRTVNNVEPSDLLVQLSTDYVTNWQEKITQEIYKYLALAEKMKTLDSTQINQIRSYVEKQKQVLKLQNIKFVYWDAHFDNILVKNDKIVGLLDFERTELASIDFTLDIVRRMVKFPTKYMSEHAEKFAVSEHYENLMNWFREFYPELFDFPEIDTRLSLYDISHCLRDLKYWPHVKELKNNIMDTVSTSIDY